MPTKKIKIYFDTSVPSSFYDTSSPDLTGFTRLFWNDYLTKFDIFISEATLQEINRTADLQKRTLVLKLIKDITILKISNKVAELANQYLNNKVVPANYPIDALHLACATINQIDFLATWNISHMANPNKRKLLTNFNASQGLFIPQLTTPEEIIKTYEQNN